jgi:hypothetical protein
MSQKRNEDKKAPGYRKRFQIEIFAKGKMHTFAETDSTEEVMKFIEMLRNGRWFHVYKDNLYLWDNEHDGGTGVDVAVDDGKYVLDYLKELMRGE